MRNTTASSPEPMSRVPRLLLRVGSLKQTLNRRLAACFAPTLPAALVRRAVDEAERLAQATGFPHLFLPVLAEEKCGPRPDWRSDGRPDSGRASRR